MSGETVLTPYFRRIEGCGGTGSCTITFVRLPSTGSLKEHISGVHFTVEVMVPFFHSGRSLIAAGRGVHELETSFEVNSMKDVEYPFQQGRMAAMRAALADLVVNASAEIVAARPTTSRNRQRRKIASLLRSIGADGLV